MGPGKFDKLCVFGNFEDNELYSRNSSIVAAVSELAGETVELRPPRGSSADSNHQRLSGISRIFRSLWEQLLACCSLIHHRSTLRGCDVVLVPYPAYIDVLVLRLLLPRGQRVTVLVDAFLCLHDTLVNDRQMVREGGAVGRLVHALESAMLRFADLALIDTEQQRQKLLHDYDLPDERVLALPVGIDEELWQQLPPAPLVRDFQVLFWGTFIPLHGIETIVRAAAILAEQDPSVKFTLVGTGQTADETAALLDRLSPGNVTWHRKLLKGRELRALAVDAHCLLGVFGDSEKAGSVVPYKVYQAMASNRALISRRGPATSHLAAESLYLVEPSDPAALAEAIGRLRRDYAGLSPRINTRELYERQFSQRAIRERLAEGVAHL